GSREDRARGSARHPGDHRLPSLRAELRPPARHGAVRGRAPREGRGHRGRGVAPPGAGPGRQRHAGRRHSRLRAQRRGGRRRHPCARRGDILGPVTTTRSGPARPPRLLPIAGLVALVPPAGAPPLWAHDFYLIPETAAPGAGATIRLALHVSEVFPGDPVDWRADKTSQFFLQDAKGRLDLKDRVPEGKPLMPRVTLRSPGTTVIALVTEP